LSGLVTSESISAGVAFSVLGGLGDDTITGTDSADSITGNAGRDVIDGGKGDDSFIYADRLDLFVANALVDTIDGGTGTDSIVISNGAAAFRIGVDDDFGTITSVEQIIATATDQIIDITLHADAVADGIVTVDLSGDTDILGANQIDADAITGTTGMTLTGSAGVDTITGTDNDDVITGGAGADVLTGGRGDDTFNYTVALTDALAANVDTITDFEVGTNVIDFTDLTNADLRGTGVGFETVAKGANAVAANTGIVLQNGDEADLLVATALAAANTMTGWNAGDIVYFIATTGTDSALYRIAETTGDTTLDSALLVVTLTGVDETDFLAANFADFV
jgi:Ca2+-binding RTX toxin-like protein